MGDYQALAALAEQVLGVDDHTDDEFDWSSLTEPVSLQPDPLPPFTLGTHVKKGEWPSQGSSSPTASDDSIKYSNCNDDPTSPGSDGGELIPPSPVISSTKRKGRRKHKLGRVGKKTCQLSYSPLVSQEENAGQISFLDSLEQLPDTDSPPSKMAASLGCDGRNSEWVNTMETPTTVKTENRGLAVLNTVERETLLPCGKMISSPEFDVMVKDNLNESDAIKSPISPILASKATTSTPIRVVPRQGRSRDLVKTLFCRDQEVQGLSQVVTIRREDLHEVDSDSEDEVKDQVSSISGVNLITGKVNVPSAGKKERLAGTQDMQSVKEEYNGTNDIFKHEFAREEKESARPLPLAAIVEDAEHGTCHFPGGFSTASGRKIEVSENALTEARKKLLKCQEHVSSFVNVVPPETKFTGGFTSAGGRKIEVSEKALAAARSKLNISLKEQYTFSGGSMTAGGDLSQVQDTVAASKDKYMNKDSEPSTSNFTGGFMTAGGSKIQVSEVALAKARDKFGITKQEKESPHDNFPGGFSTAGGAKIEVSEKALAVAMNKMISPKKEFEAPAVRYTGGFSTAGGKEIKVSDEALALAKDKMKRSVKVNENNDITHNNEFAGFRSASGVKIEVSDKALEQAKNQMKGLMKENELIHSSESRLTNRCFKAGFSTAAGVDVAVSQRALEVAKAKMNHSGELKVPTKKFIAGFTTGKGSKIEVSEKALETARNNMANNTAGLLNNCITAGFSTAKGTKIEVSEKALAAAKNRLEASNIKENIPNLAKSFGVASNGFSTASGGKIEISAKALSDAKCRMDFKESTPLNKISGPQKKSCHT